MNPGKLALLSVDDAMSLLAGELGHVHVTDALLGNGCAWSWSDVRAWFERHQPELAGYNAVVVGHGVAAGGRFFATNDTALRKFEGKEDA